MNGEEMEDFLVLQRDFEADGGLTPVGETEILELRSRAVQAIAAVFEELDLAQADRRHDGERGRGLRLGGDARATCRATSPSSARRSRRAAST